MTTWVSSFAERQNQYGNCFAEINKGFIERLPDGGFKISMNSGDITFYAYANYELNDGNLLAPETIYGGDVVSATPSQITREAILSMMCESNG